MARANALVCIDDHRREIGDPTGKYDTIMGGDLELLDPTIESPLLFFVVSQRTLLELVLVSPEKQTKKIEKKTMFVLICNENWDYDLEIRQDSPPFYIPSPYEEEDSWK